MFGIDFEKLAAMLPQMQEMAEKVVKSFTEIQQEQALQSAQLERIEQKLDALLKGNDDV